MKFEYPIGATPLDQDEIIGLIPPHITTQQQLNEWESANILQAELWLFSRHNHGDFLSLNFTKQIHAKMFDNTWLWAGQFRTTEKNIGISPFKITTDLNNLLEDVRYQLLNNVISVDEIAYRFHHRLVAIHPFANGNGRHARLHTDLVLVQAGQPRFTWGRKKLDAKGFVRNQYINALRNADNHNYTALANFVRS